MPEQMVMVQRIQAHTNEAQFTTKQEPSMVVQTGAKQDFYSMCGRTTGTT
jgi:hypothetical protein